MNAYNNPNYSHLVFIQIKNLVRINRNSDWFRLFQIENLVRIHSDWCLGFNQIRSNWFLAVFHQTRYKTFFGLARNDWIVRKQIPEWLGKALICSEWNSIWYFRQGILHFCVTCIIVNSSSNSSRAPSIGTSILGKRTFET